jgi:hypothetical protein
MTSKLIYEGWVIRAGSVVVGSQFKAAAVLEWHDPHQDDEPDRRYCFSDLGDYSTSEDAENRAIQWARAWIDENYA